MKNVFLALFTFLAFTLSAQPFEVALNVNAPLSAGAIAPQIQPSVIAELGVDSVRLNMILGPWSSIHDATKYGNPPRDWFETYDAIVDDFLAEGIEIYMLINQEAVDGTNRAALQTEPWTLYYAEVFGDIVDHFKDRVTVYEMFNEPNDWAGGTSAQVPAEWFAYQMQEIYRTVKVGPGGSHLGDSSYQDLILVSGPLFSHDIGGTPHPQQEYWQATRLAGVNGHGSIPNLDWGALHAQTGSYPYDGIGYHIYVYENSTNATNIRQRVDYHLDTLWSEVTALEGAGTDKKIWLSEFGWRNAALEDFLSPADASQAQMNNLEVAFDLYRDDPRVQQAQWFSLVDFGSVDNWGIYTNSNLPSSARKPAWWGLRWQGVIGDETDGNLLTNAGFETGNLTGWTEYGDTDDVATGTWFGGVEAFAGSWFHGAAANFGQRDGGLYQRVTGLTNGQVYAAGARVRTFREGGSVGDTACRVGIDPTGGTNPTSGNIIWSEPLDTANYWRPLCVQATAQGTAVTIFLEHDQAAPTWNVTAFDDAVLKNGGAAIDRGATITPLNLSFGSIGVGATSAAKSVTIRNDGTTDLSVTGVTLGGSNAGEFRIASDSGETTLGAGAQRIVSLVLEPTSAGPKSATLTVTTDDPDQLSTQVALSGNAAAGGVSNCVEFGDNMAALAIQPSNSDLLHGLNGTITGGGFHPAVPNSIGVLTDGIAPTNQAVLADYADPSLQVVFDLGEVKTLEEIRVFSMALDGRVFQHWSVETSGNGSDWSFLDDQVLSEPDGEFPSSLTNSLGSFAGAAMTCVTPSVGDTLATTRYLRFTFIVVADGFSITAFNPPESAHAGSTIVEIDVIESNVTPTAPEIEVAPTSLGFGNRGINAGATSSQNVTITNTGDATLLVSSVGVIGAGASDFTITADSGEGTLAPFESRTVSVAFDPTAVGSRLATLRIASNDSDESVVDVALSGVGVDDTPTAPEITVRPTSLGFDVQSLSDPPSPPQDVTIQNIGDADLSISFIGIVGPAASDFNISDDSGENPLEPLDTRVVRVVFTPTETGYRGATLRIASNDLDEPTVDVPLDGDADPATPLGVTLN